MRPVLSIQITVITAIFALVACSATGNLETAERSNFEHDREAILSMVGVFDVRFDFIETVSFAEGYEPKPRKLSGAYEVVRVVEDSGDVIRLQHILYVGDDTFRMPLKHWRQDWHYEPRKVLTFVGGNAWQTEPVAARDRRGAWSQQVYQVDDSPRYGAVGRWSYDSGVAEWQAARAWRPLPRRDMTTRDDYHVMNAVNRHVITPTGWVHEQDNTKVVLSDEEPRALVREVAINTYTRTDVFSPEEIDAYWQKTEPFWSDIRAVWESYEDEGAPFALTVKGEPDELYMPLLNLASAVEEGEMTLTEATREARSVIGTFTTTDLPPLPARLRTTKPSATGSNEQY